MVPVTGLSKDRISGVITPAADSDCLLDSGKSRLRPPTWLLDVVEPPSEQAANTSTNDSTVKIRFENIT